MQEWQSRLNFLLVCASIFLVWGFAYAWSAGWPKLAARYKQVATANAISEGSHRWVACRMKETPLSVSIEIYPHGLWLQPGWPLSFFMPAVLIPWEKLQANRAGKTLFGVRTDLAVEGYGIISLTGAAGVAVVDKAGRFRA